MPEPPFTLAYRKRRDGDGSWNPDWFPVPTIPGQNAFEGWEDMPESEFGELVERIVGDAFALLYEAHPRLRGNRYLNGLRERIGR